MNAPRTLKDREAVKRQFDCIFALGVLEKKSSIYEYLLEIFFCLNKDESNNLKKLVNPNYS